MRTGRVAAVLAVLLVAACSAEPDRPGGVTADEAQQLNEAAAMLDNDSVSAAGPANAEADR